MMVTRPLVPVDREVFDARIMELRADVERIWEIVGPLGEGLPSQGEEAARSASEDTQASQREGEHNG